MQEPNEKLRLNGKIGGITFALFIAGYIVVAVLGQLIVGAIFGEGAAYRAICACFSSACVLAVLLFYVLYGKHGFRELTSTNRLGGWYVLLALLLSIGMFLGLGFVNQSIATIFSSWGLNGGVIRLNIPTVWHFLVYTLTFAVLPAVFEEILFRGILLNCFAGMKRIFAVLICSLIFALYHQSLTQFLYQFIYGVALSYLAILSKSIVPCVLAHFLNNFTVILFTFLQVSLDLFNPLIIVIGANALAFFGAIIFFIQRKNEKVLPVKGEVKAFFLPFGLFGIVVCLAVAVGNLVV